MELIANFYDDRGVLVNSYPTNSAVDDMDQIVGAWLTNFPAGSVTFTKAK